MQAHPQSFSSKSIKLPGLARAAQGEIDWSQSERWRAFPIQGERDRAGKQSWPWETVSADRRSWSSVWTARLLDGGIFPRHPENPVHELQLSVTPGSHPTRTNAFRLDWAPNAGVPASSEPTRAGFSEPVSTSTLPCPWERRSTTGGEQHGTKPCTALQSCSKLDPHPKQSFAAAWSHPEGHW